MLFYFSPILIQTLGLALVTISPEFRFQYPFVLFSHFAWVTLFIKKTKSTYLITKLMLIVTYIKTYFRQDNKNLLKESQLLLTPLRHKNHGTNKRF